VFRILYVENGQKGGGSAESLYQLLKVIDRKKFHPIVVFTHNIPIIKKFSQIGVKTVLLEDWYFSRKGTHFFKVLAHCMNAIVIYGSFLFPKLAFNLESFLMAKLRKRVERLIEYENINLIHSNNNVHRDLWVAEAAQNKKIVCVSHLRSFHALGFSLPRVMRANKIIHAYIAYSRSVAYFWQEKGLLADKTCVIHNAIGPSTMRAIDVRLVCGFSPKTKIIGLVGRIIPERGHELLIKAMPAILRGFPDLKVIIIGGYEESAANRLKRVARSYGVTSELVFLGYRADAYQLMMSLDLGVLPYSIEPFGRTLLEYWQAGIPVVASNVGYIADIVVDKKDALLFECDKAADLASKILMALNDHDLREKLSDSGRKKCAALFSIDSHRIAVESTYIRLLNQNQFGSKGAMSEF
jgi:glycosyltransferase involved in cell wall biosynthesis